MNTAARPTRRPPAVHASAATTADPLPCQSAGRAPAAPADAPAGPPSEPSADAARVLRQFRIVFNAVKTHFQQVERQAGIGGAKIWALSLIAAQPDIGVGALARAMDVHQTTASNLVRSLSTLGYIVAHRKGTDRRSVHLRATPSGRRLLASSPGPFAGVLPGALEQLPADCLARLQVDLDRLIATLHADPQAGGIPLAEM